MPMCYLCGAPNDNLGLCAECQYKKRTADRAETGYTQKKVSFQADRNSLMTPNALSCIAVAASILTALFIKFVIFAPQPANFLNEGSYFVVSDESGSTKIRYTIGGRHSIKGNVYEHLLQSASVNEGGILIQLHYLLPGSYEQFKREYGNTQKCAASFYNANMKHTMVLSKDKECLNKLSGRSFDTWENFTISGTELSFYDGYRNGKRIAPPSGPFNYFLVDSCEQLDKHLNSSGPATGKDPW